MADLLGAEGAKHADTVSSPMSPSSLVSAQDSMMSAQFFDCHGPCLVLAPHLEYPLRNGADILIDRRWSAFSRFVPFVDIVGRETIVRYRQGKPSERWRFRNQRIAPSVAAMKALLKNGHYLHEKLVTSAFRREAQARAARESYGTLVFSLICTSSLWSDLAHRGGLACVETHNDEIKWFSDMRRHASNPLTRMVARASEAWLLRHLRHDSRQFVYLHVSAGDQEGYAKRSLCPRSLVAPAGVELPDPDLGAPPRNIARSPLVLTFLGSLSVKINRDALRHFADRYFPGLKETFGPELVVRVIGSSPNSLVRKLCTRHGWELFPDVSDSELSTLLFETSFAILPFEYSTGLKLKLLVALSHGVPVLCTSVAAQMPNLPPVCLVSDNPQDWVDHVSTVRKCGIISPTDRRALLALARSFSWDAIAKSLRDRLASL